MKFNQTIQWLNTFGLLLTLSFPAYSSNTTIIEVFTEYPMDHTYRIPKTKITFYNLNQPTQAEKLLPTFSNNPKTAEQQFQQWKNSANGQAMMRQMKDSYTPFLKAASYGLTRTPAIVFDEGKYVIYGTTNVGHAVQDYDDYIKQGGRK